MEIGRVFVRPKVRLLKNTTPHIISEKIRYNHSNYSILSINWGCGFKMHNQPTAQTGSLGFIMEGPRIWGFTTGIPKEPLDFEEGY